MANPIVIIHGWSDSQSSFVKLASLLEQSLDRPVKELWLGNYISLNDDVRVDDIADALQKEWLHQELGTRANSIDVVIHSTGGLVIRHWMQKFFNSVDIKPPVRNLVMLAPANFGSPLAHTGRSFIGRALKGEDGFQTGTQVLKALEMASPYTFGLAATDRFQPNAFSRGGVRCTVIVGNKGYDGLKAMANKRGSDGTVYVATANLNCARVRLDVIRNADEEAMDQIRVNPVEQSRGEAAFLVLDRFNHGDVTCNDLRGTRRKLALNAITEALGVSAATFPAWKEECRKRTDELYAKKHAGKNAHYHAYQNTVFHVVDDQGNDVTDYVIEFYGDFEKLRRDRVADIFHEDVSAKVHAYKDNESYRSFMLDTSALQSKLNKQGEALKISLSAAPDYKDRDQYVGYKTFAEDEIGAVEISVDQLSTYFDHNRTLFVEITLPRYQKREVFTLQKVAD